MKKKKKIKNYKEKTGSRIKRDYDKNIIEKEKEKRDKEKIDKEDKEDDNIDKNKKRDKDKPFKKDSAIKEKLRISNPDKNLKLEKVKDKE